MMKSDWLDHLSDEDRGFIKRFVLASGSLKALAEVYDVSYPTIRLRLDRVIQRIQIFDSEKITSDFEKTLRAQVADGKLDLATFKIIMQAHRKELEDEQETVHSDRDHTASRRR